MGERVDVRARGWHENEKNRIDLEASFLNAPLPRVTTATPTATAFQISNVPVFRCSDAPMLRRSDSEACDVCGSRAETEKNAILLCGESSLKLRSPRGVAHVVVPRGVESPRVPPHASW